MAGDDARTALARHASSWRCNGGIFVDKYCIVPFDSPIFPSVRHFPLLPGHRRALPSRAALYPTIRPYEPTVLCGLMMQVESLGRLPNNLALFIW